MFKELNISYWFIGGLIIWGIIAFLRRNGILIPLINDHLTDLYSVPMFSLYDNENHEAHLLSGLETGSEVFAGSCT
ncbi:Uncharacterised protein [Sphingobacterium daejeonense]|nr:Uncharacterised protein [Sphingobacterium daejeonense]